jgi:cytochrome c biogenesis protein CcmG/thiol:disulfide interchange protein DsbE
VRVALGSLLALAAVACTSEPPEETRDATRVIEIEGTLPPLSGETLAGDDLAMEDLEGRPVVVNFWATWCGPCEREQPMLVDAHREIGGRVAFLGVDYRDQDDAAREWLDRYDVEYPNVADPNGSLALRFGVTTGLPTTIVVDADGRLRFRVLGEIDRATLDDLVRRVERA